MDKQQRDHSLRTDRSRSNRVGLEELKLFYWPNPCSILCCYKTQNEFSSRGGLLTYAMHHQREQQNQLTYCDETTKRALSSQCVRAKENPR